MKLLLFHFFIHIIFQFNPLLNKITRFNRLQNYHPWYINLAWNILLQYYLYIFLWLNLKKHLILNQICLYVIFLCRTGVVSSSNLEILIYRLDLKILFYGYYLNDLYNSFSNNLKIFVLVFYLHYYIISSSLKQLNP